MRLGGERDRAGEGYVTDGFSHRIVLMVLIAAMG